MHLGRVEVLDGSYRSREKEGGVHVEVAYFRGWLKLHPM